jgi:periplasmic protein TonB
VAEVISNTPVYEGNAEHSRERRLQVRQPVSALAYLDIGGDNGGIVLNLSEEGMELQAVGTLDRQTEVNLRIQLPGSQARIETAAQVMWLSETNRQAGVRFVSMPSQVRAQIREWIRTQGLPAEPSEVFGPRELASELPQKQETIADPRTDNWLSLLAEAPEQAPRDAQVETDAHLGTQAKQPGALRPARATLQDLSTRLRAPGATSARVGEVAKSPSEDGTTKQIPPLSLPYESRNAPPESDSQSQRKEQNNDHAPFTGPSQHKPANEALDWPTPAARRTASTTVPMDTPRVSSSPLLPSAGPLPPNVESPMNSILTTESRVALALSATKAKHAGRWVGVTALFVLFSVLCFGVGTWVGPLGRGNSVQIPAPPASPAPAPPASVSSASTAAAAPGPHELTPRVAHEVREGRSARSSRPAQNRKRELAPPASSPLDLPMYAAVQSPPIQEVPAPVRITPAVTKPLEKSSAPAPVPDASTAGVPAQRIVAGRVLRPTDRFNPCHLTYRVEPAYPVEAQRRRMEGAVKIHLTIGTDGAVRSVKLISGTPLLAVAALDAAQYWRYMPALLNGEPVETEQDIEIDFRLPQ